jgi:gamma-glutamyltranspeptidase/glutathione hydrolase
MVASAHPLATEAGRRMLREGGNAFDAITAVSFMLAVVEPSMSGLGGRLQAIWQLPDGTVSGMDATTQVPASYLKRQKEEENGFGTIGVPGMVKGITEMHKRYGRLPLKTVMRPAIEAADKGHSLHADESRRQSLELKELRRFSATARHFLPKDTVAAGGSLFRQPALASALKMIAKDGGRSFYSGSIGYALAREVTEGGGFLTMSDMEAYRAGDARILRGHYRGYEILGMGLPCYGAIVIEMLQMLEQTDLSGCSEADFLLRHAAVHYKAYEDRPLLKTIEDTLVRPSFARNRWADSVPAGMLPPTPADTADHANGHTTHLVASDRYGNVVSLTQSLGPLMGSKVASARYGFMLATTMGPYLGAMKAGDRAASHISPILVLKDGRPVMALGAAGGARIVPAIVQVISRHIDQGMPIAAALAAGRVYQMPDRLLLENHKGVTWKDNRTPERIRAAVRKTDEVRSPAQFGRVHALLRLPDGTWVGAADPDWSGTAAGVD